MIWMHGRTVNKELDAGRYLRWIRAGIAAVSLDLPGHGERLDPVMQTPQRTLDVIATMRAEIDGVLVALRAESFKGIFDLSRCAIGGMSAGGMVALRRLCDPHPFVSAAVECTSGWLQGLYFPTDLPGATARARWEVEHERSKVIALDAAEHLASWRPIPLLALHSKADELVPFAVQAEFLRRLRAHYESVGADPSQIELHTWDVTGAPLEHSGFGRFSNEAKNLQTSFLARLLGATPQVIE
jgi:alpha-beta hydrolase superfamily lysophospholipase